MQPTKEKYKYEYQGQEHQTELGLNWSSFKYRNYDYAIGRFMSVDPLAEKYPYNSTYAFSENRVVSHFELEGLESILAITLGKDINYRGNILKAANNKTIHQNITNGNVNNFVASFEYATKSDPKGIGFVAIWGHGIPGEIYGSGVNVSINISDLSQLNEAIKNGKIKFAENAIIYLGNCNSATNSYNFNTSFAAKLSEITNTTVIGGNNSVGVGLEGNQVENKNSMIYWMYNPKTDNFISFKNGKEIKKLGGKIDVVKLMNFAMRKTNPVESISTGDINPIEIEIKPEINININQ